MIEAVDVVRRENVSREPVPVIIARSTTFRRSRNVACHEYWVRRLETSRARGKP
jgi:hypothetical protein